MGLEIFPGTRFGDLTFVEKTIVKEGVQQALFSCACGSQVEKSLTRVKSGHIHSCGCRKKKSPRALSSESMLGKRFGRLVVTEQLLTKNHRTQWKCLCDCGSQVDVNSHTLRNGHTRSCGCLHRDATQTNKSRLGKRPSNWKGVGDMPGYHWTVILASAKSRGLEVSVTQQECVDLFQKQDGTCALTGRHIWFVPIGGARGSGTASLDRIDSSKGYSLDNIQWVHKDLQKMKWDFPQDTFVDWCHAVSDYHRSTKPVAQVLVGP